MTNHPLVSVLIRTLWRESLSVTLKSVQSQTYPHLEIVLIGPKKGHWLNLGQDDKTPLKLVHTEQQSPRAQAANLALDHSSGEYCIFLDDDDWWDPTHISNLVEALKSVEPRTQGHHIDTTKDTWVAHSLTQMVSSSHEKSDVPADIQGGVLDPIRLLAGNSLAIHSVLFPSALVRSKGCRFDESFDLFEDWDFWLQISQLANFLLVAKATAFYKIHESSGVHALKPFDNMAAHSIYRKWIPRLTNAELSQLMGWAWRKFDLEKERDQLLLERVELLEQLNVLKQENHLLNQAINEAEHTKKVLNEILQSHSWRITAPLRSLIRALKGPRQSSLVDKLMPDLTPSTKLNLFPDWVKTLFRPYLYPYLLTKSWLSKALNPTGFGENHSKHPAQAQRPLGIHHKESISENRFALLCTYSPNGVLSPATLHYLNQLNKTGLRVILCVATEGVQTVSEKGLDAAAAIFTRQNAGFDFASWAATLSALPELMNAKSLIFTNDSVLGPMGDFEQLIQRINDSSRDFVALTDSQQIKHHTQSYFFALQRNALQHHRVQGFWRNLQSLKKKDDVILHYELGLLNLIESAGLSVEVIFPVNGLVQNLESTDSRRKLSRINPTHQLWRELIEQDFPFIKVQLLAENPYRLDISLWAKLVNDHDTDHILVELAKEHLQYLSQTRATKVQLETKWSPF